MLQLLAVVEVPNIIYKVAQVVLAEAVVIMEALAVLEQLIRVMLAALAVPMTGVAPVAAEPVVLVVAALQEMVLQVQ